MFSKPETYLASRGRLVQDRGTKEPKLNCRNWECGVIVPVIQEEDSSTGGEEKNTEKEKMDNDNDGDMARIFGSGVVPVPMRIPAPSFAAAEHDRKPWYGAW